MKNSILAVTLGFFVSGNALAGGVLADIGRAVGSAVGGDAGKAITKASDEGDKAHKQIKEANPVYKAVEENGSKAVRDTAAATAKAAEDAAKATAKALADADRERRQAEKQIEGAVKAASNFTENQFKSVGDSLSNAEERLREGKILDAAFHLGTDQITNTSSNAAQAVQKSPLLNQVAAAAASAYGGPAGAAAYASWLTYETTGDLEAALKAGVLAGASSYANQYSQDVQAIDLSPELKKEIAQFSVNAAAIAASGGSEQDVLNALKVQATSAATSQVKALGEQWVKDDVIPLIADKSDLDQAPKSWEQLSVVEKAKKVSASVDRFKEDVRQQIIEKTKIDPATITLTANKN